MNEAFDIPYTIARIVELGMDPIEVMCHKDFEIKELYYKKDTDNFAIANKGDFFKISSYTAYLDQMIMYAGNRKGQGELRSYALNYVAQVEIQDEKLDYAEEANIKTLPYVNYKKFVMYNIKDVLLQLGIERRTKDIDGIYQRAYTNATKYDKIFKQTVFLKNRAYVEYYKQGIIIGNNINRNYNYNDRSIRKDGDEDERFEGAVVADPMLNLHEGIELFGTSSMFIFDNVVDMDFSSMYPHIIIAFNIAPNCMVGKLVIDRSYIDIANDTSVDIVDQGKEFMDNLLVGDVSAMGVRWFSLPRIEELNEMIVKHFGIKKTRRLNMRVDQVAPLYLNTIKVSEVRN